MKDARYSVIPAKAGIQHPAQQENTMRIIDILTSPWAIVPEKLYEIQEIYSTHLRGEKIDISAIEAKIGAAAQGDDEPYQVVNSMAVIPIQGVIAKHMNMFSRISGGVSTELVARDINSAAHDPDINGILLDIDSPGGTVDGTLELAQTVFQARAQKPVIAYTDGIMASAAYWIGSAAERVFISGDTVHVGSIGVVATHVDYSAYEKRVGIKTTEIYAGKYKRIASEHKPLSKEGKQTIQDRVDYIYSVFVDAVATQRGQTPEAVLEKMADGRLFIGRQAIAARLVDGVSTIDRLIDTVLPQMQADRADAAWLHELNSETRHERTAAKKKDLDAARAGLDDAMARMGPVY